MFDGVLIFDLFLKNFIKVEFSIAVLPTSVVIEGQKTNGIDISCIQFFGNVRKEKNSNKCILIF